MPTQLPLLSPTVPLDAPIAWQRGQPVSRATFLGDVARVARQLPPAQFIFNLCEDRWFLVAFAAIGSSAPRVSLLPSVAPANARQRTKTIPIAGLLRMSISPSGWRWQPTHRCRFPISWRIRPWRLHFTSGSTGHAKPNPKRWGELVNGAEQARQRFGFGAGMSLVATVPPPAYVWSGNFDYGSR